MGLFDESQYYQLLCIQGHYWMEDFQCFTQESSVCPHCKEGVLWENLVTEVGHAVYNYVTMEPYRLVASTDQKPAIYRVPKVSNSSQGVN